MMQKQISVSTLNWGPCVIKLKIEDVFKELLLTESKNNTEDYRSKLAGILDKETGYNAKSKEDKQKILESLQKTFKKAHKFRHSPMIDYKSIEKMIKNII